MHFLKSQLFQKPQFQKFNQTHSKSERENTYVRYLYLWDNYSLFSLLLWDALKMKIRYNKLRDIIRFNSFFTLDIGDSERHFTKVFSTLPVSMIQGPYLYTKPRTHLHSVYNLLCRRRQGPSSWLTNVQVSRGLALWWSSSGYGSNKTVSISGRWR